MPLLPALRAFFTRLLTDVDDALFPQHVFCLTCGALSLPNAICPACLAVLDDLRLPGGRHGIRVSLCPAAEHGCHLRPDDEKTP